MFNPKSVLGKYQYDAYLTKLKTLTNYVNPHKFKFYINL
jgi:hypothetical protein